MSTIIKAKRSSVQGKVPLTTDLELGEFAINTFDGKLYTKKNENGSESIVDLSRGNTNLGYSANSSAVTVTSDTGNDINVLAANNTTAGVLTATAQTIGGNKTFTGDILFDTVGGNEGGEIKLAASPTGGTLAGAVSIDIYQNRLRIFENGGTNRGVYIDLTSASSTVGTNLLATAGATSITTSANGSSVTVISDTGNDGVILAANSTAAGVITAEAQTIGGDKTFTGNVTANIVIASNNGNGTNFQIGDDVWIGDINTANTLRVTGQQDTTQGYIVFGNSNNTALGRSGTGSLTYGGSAIILASDTTSTSTASKVVVRDASSNFAANTITATLTGNATTATTLQTSRTIGGVSFDGSANINLPGVNTTGNQNTTGSAATLTTARTISLGGDLSGSASFNGSADITITATVQPDSVALGTDTTGNYVSSVTGGTGVTITGTLGEGWTPTVSIGQNVSATSNVEFHDLILSGNLTINGTTTTINATQLAISDNIIYLNDGLAISNPDLGIVGNYDDGTYAHTGVFRDATDNRWKFFTGYTPEPGQTIDTTDVSFSYADVQANTIYADTIGIGTTSTNAKLVVSNAGAGGIEFTPGNFGNFITHINRSGGSLIGAAHNASSHGFLIDFNTILSINSTGASVTGTLDATALSIGGTTLTPTAIELNYVDGVTSAIQTQLNNKSPLAGSSSLTTTGTVTSGTWSGLFGAVSGANLTSLTAGNLTGTIPSAVLGNSTLYVGSTAIALNRATGSQTLTGVSIDGNAATATTADQIDSIAFRNGNSTNGVAPDSITDNGIGYANAVSLFAQTDGALYSQAHSSSWVHQIFGDYRTGQLAVRGKNNGTWQSWRTILDSTNYSTYASPLAGSSSLTTTGTVTSGTWSGSFGAVSGANLTSLTAGNLSGTIPSAVLGNSTQYIGTTAIALNRASGSQTLTGVSIDGNASTATTLTTPAMIQGTDIPGSADLNTYTTPGFYHQNTNANATSGTNYPNTVAGMLEVMADGTMVYQRYTVYSSGQIYTRSYYNGAWYAWRLELDSGNYNSYAPTLTGTGASGSWSINAATATTATNQSGGTIDATTGTVTPNATGVSTGLTVVNGDLTAYRSGGTTGVIYLSSSGTKYLYYNGTNYEFGTGGLVPTANNTYDLGTTTMRWNVMYGTATAARYADLAEKYLADDDYPVGTVMSVGGDAEVTAATPETAHSIVGVVSEKPAYLMNDCLEGGTAIALRGRVPVRVVGVVKKGDRLTVSITPGCAVSDNNAVRSFAIALHDSNETEVVEAIIL